MKRTDKRLNSAIGVALKGFKPPELLTVSEWADKNRRLSSEGSAEVGAWRTSRTPYLKEIMDAFSDPKVRHIVLVSSSQVGKSEMINNMIGYCIAQDPSSILFVQPTKEDAREYSKTRIAPMIRDCKALREKVADPKSRDSANTILQKSFPGGMLTMCGSVEAHALASKPVRYLFGDERDRWVGSTGKEGDPWLLATARQATFYNAKSVEVSTPTVKGASAIEKAYIKGTKERWNTRCPHCLEYSEITFDNIRFEKENIGSEKERQYKVTRIFYICPKCGGVSSENEIKRQPSQWIAEKPEAYDLFGTRSFWLSSWVSPWKSWESTIIEFLEALDDRRKLQVIYNTRFGLLWENREDSEDEDGMLERREEYKADLPDGVLCLTCGIDTQDDRFEYEVVGHGHFGETWGIRKGLIMGRPDSDEAWQGIDDLLDTVFNFENGVGLRLSLTFIDEGGHFTSEVRLRCRERQSKMLFPIKGRGGESVPYTSNPRPQKIILRNKTLGTCPVFEIGVDAGKAIIMDNLKVRQPGPKYCHFPARDDYGAEYFHGLLSEKMTYVTDKRGSRWQWQKLPGHERNEPFDCRVYALAAADILHPNWDALEARIREGASARQVIGPRQSVSSAQSKTATKKSNKAIDKYYEGW